MSKMRGLELIAIGKTQFFEIFYEGKGIYKNIKGDIIENLLDMSCYGCGSAYYSLDGDVIDFCPNCGHFEKHKFEALTDLIDCIRGQNWGFLKFSGNSVFAVQKKDKWQLAFAKSEDELLKEGICQSIHKL